MKRNEWMAIIATSFLMFAICLSATVQTNKKTEHKNTRTYSASMQNMSLCIDICLQQR